MNKQENPRPGAAEGLSSNDVSPSRALCNQTIDKSSEKCAKLELSGAEEPADALLDIAEIRRFLEIIHAQAARLAEPLKAQGQHPGCLQLDFINPFNGTTIPHRYNIGDVEKMIKDAIYYAAELNWNVYIEGRTVRSDLKKGRGEVNDTVFVFALVVDDDRDKGRSCKLDIESSLVVESSPGNRHLWLFFDRAMGAHAIELGRGLRVAAGDVDGCTGTITSLFRVAGTRNFPDPGKISRGRTISATSILARGGKLWSPEEMERAFPPVPEHRSADADHGIGDYEVALLAELLKAIPNNPPVQYEAWRNVLFASKWAADQAVSDGVKKQIKALFYAWSDQAKGCRGAKPDPGDKQINRIWNSARSDRERPITVGTIVKYAQECGLSLQEADWKITKAWADSIDRATEDYIKNNNLLNDVGAS